MYWTLFIYLHIQVKLRNPFLFKISWQLTRFEMGGEDLDYDQDRKLANCIYPNLLQTKLRNGGSLNVWGWHKKKTASICQFGTSIVKSTSTPGKSNQDEKESSSIATSEPWHESLWNPLKFRQQIDSIYEETDVIYLLIYLSHIIITENEQWSGCSNLKVRTTNKILQLSHSATLVQSILYLTIHMMPRSVSPFLLQKRLRCIAWKKILVW